MREKTTRPCGTVLSSALMYSALRLKKIFPKLIVVSSTSVQGIFICLAFQLSCMGAVVAIGVISFVQLS